MANAHDENIKTIDKNANNEIKSIKKTTSELLKEVYSENIKSKSDISESLKANGYKDGLSSSAKALIDNASSSAIGKINEASQKAIKEVENNKNDIKAKIGNQKQADEYSKSLNGANIEISGKKEGASYAFKLLKNGIYSPMLSKIIGVKDDVIKSYIAKVNESSVKKSTKKSTKTTAKSSSSKTSNKKYSDNPFSNGRKVKKSSTKKR